MERELSKNEARQGNPRRFQWRVFLISTGITAVIMAALYFIFLAGTP